MSEEGGGGLNRGSGEPPCSGKNGPHAQHDAPNTESRTQLDSGGDCGSRGQGGAQWDSLEHQKACGAVRAGDENDDPGPGESLDAEDPGWAKRRRRRA